MDCKRVNVFIGKPNVGKSNILEAIGILGIENTVFGGNDLESIVRFEELSNLFYDDDMQQSIEIECNLGKAMLLQEPNNPVFGVLLLGDLETLNQLADFDSNKENIYSFIDRLFSKAPPQSTISFSPFFVTLGVDGRRTNGSPYKSFVSNPVKKYHFSPFLKSNANATTFLIPPYGPNLFSVVDHNKELRKEIASIFAQYGLEFVAFKKEQRFEIQKNIDGYVTKYNYSSIADTFQRLIFYFAAIDSNEESILVLEEPEVHSFPPYTKELADRIVASEQNQFFITTHSPYMLQNLVSELGVDELNVVITYYEDYQTKVKVLTEDELSRVSDFGIDLFYNLDEFTSND